jgi:uncharacterized protein YvpB
VRLGVAAIVMMGALAVGLAPGQARAAGCVETTDGVAVQCDQPGGVDLDGFGGLHPFGGYPLDAQGAPYWPGWDIARSLQLMPGGGGGWELDGFGSIHPFGGAPPLGPEPYWEGWDIARSLVVYETASGAFQGYELDGFGGIHPLNGAPALSGYAYWPGSDVARGLVLSFDPRGVPDGGLLLDGYGGLHPFGAYPAAALSLPYYPGHDVYQHLDVVDGVVYATGQYGVVVAVTAGATLSPSWAGYNDWGSWGIEREVVLGTGRGGRGAQPVSDDALASFDEATGVTHVILGLSAYNSQSYRQDCEAASLQNALEHEGIASSQAQILALEGVETSVPGVGPGYSGDPDVNFVGPPNGPGTSRFEPGVYAPPVARAAAALGGQVLQSGENISPSQLVLDIMGNHPAVAWVTFNFQEYAATLIQQGADTVPWAGDHEHAVLVYGFAGSSFLIWNPWDVNAGTAAYTGVAAVPMTTFDGAYSTYSDMAVVLQ